MNQQMSGKDGRECTAQSIMKSRHEQVKARWIENRLMSKRNKVKLIMINKKKI